MIHWIKRYTEPILIPLLKEVNPDGYFRYYDEYKNTLINDKEAVYYKVYKGSSEMNTIEFKGLLDGLISECKECGIETNDRRWNIKVKGKPWLCG